MAASRGHWTYTSYEAILVHMDAFSRFQISSRCPGFRNLDNLLSVKINNLKIGRRLHVDDVKIKLDKIRRIAPDSGERQIVWRDLQRTQPKMVYMFQAVGIRKDHDQQVIGTLVASENMRLGLIGKYFVEKFFKGNYRINTVDVGSNASKWFDYDDFISNFALMKTAKLLIVHDCFYMFPRDFVVLPHKRVYWNCARPVSGLLKFLISVWQRNNFPIGKRFTMPKELKRDVGVQFDFIETLPGAQKGMIEETRGTQFPNCVTFPLTNDTELNVYCLDTQEGEEYDEQQIYWNVEIHSKGHAQIL